jgi:hypothetical protein
MFVSFIEVKRINAITMTRELLSNAQAWLSVDYSDLFIGTCNSNLASV